MTLEFKCDTRIISSVTLEFKCDTRIISSVTLEFKCDSSIGRHSGGFSGNLQRFFSSGMALWRFFWKPPAVFF